MWLSAARRSSRASTTWRPSTITSRSPSETGHRLRHASPTAPAHKRGAAAAMARIQTRARVRFGALERQPGAMRRRCRYDAVHAYRRSLDRRLGVGLAADPSLVKPPGSRRVASLTECPRLYGGARNCPVVADSCFLLCTRSRCRLQRWTKNSCFAGTDSRQLTFVCGVAQGEADA